MKISVTSDLHGYLPSVDKCDMLCICGDICPTSNHRVEIQEQWLKYYFVPWINNLKTDKVILIAGNHDFWFERYGKDKKIIKEILIKPTNNKLVYLQNELYEYQSIRIFGTPYCKEFYHWAFMRPPEKLYYYYSLLPPNVDILLSHDAPNVEGIGMILEEGNWQYGVNAGNDGLTYAIKTKKPKYAFCGHIHSGDHALLNVQGTKIANVSLVNEKYEPVYKILEINI
jgi:Icc-related predicted phosphoesterase